MTNERSIDITRGIVAWYTFDDVDFNANRSRLLDRSGRGNNTEPYHIYGGLTFGSESPFGQAANFDGTDDYIRDAIPELDRAKFTTTIIVRSDNPTSNRQNVLEQSTGAEGWVLTSSDNQTALRYQVRPSDQTNTSWKRIGSVDWSDKDWHTLTMTWDGVDGGDGYGQFWADGELIGQDSFARTIETDQDSTIGRRNNADERYLDGQIAMITHHNRHLNSEEIEYLHELTNRPVSYL